mgnify:CR=1 FL=1
MPVRIYTTNAGADLSDAEAALLADLIARHGRAVLLAPTFAELDLCRHDAAEAGVSLGIDYKTPTSWLRSLWELLGDGRGFVDNLQRQMLFSDMVARLDDADLQPLSRSQGTVRMLARMARDVLPGVAGTGTERCCDNVCKPKPKSDAEARVFELLCAYARGLDRRDMVEPCEAADIMADALADNLPACTRAVCVRGITSFTHGLLELLSAVANNGGEVVVLLACEQAAMREELAAAFDARGVLFEAAPLREDAVASDAACGTAAQPAFIEVAGPMPVPMLMRTPSISWRKRTRSPRTIRLLQRPPTPYACSLFLPGHPSCSVSSPLVWRLVISLPRQLSSRRFLNPLRAGSSRRSPT